MSIETEHAYRQIVERLLRERSDVSPSEIVELLGDYVMPGPVRPARRRGRAGRDRRPTSRLCPSPRSSPPEEQARAARSGRLAACTARRRAPRRTTLTPAGRPATLHCLAGCAIGEVLGMVMATALGLGDAASIALAVVLASRSAMR